MPPIKTAFLYYSASPVMGGVEAVIASHARVFLDSGYPVTVITGAVSQAGLPRGTNIVVIPEMDAQHPEILAMNAILEQGQVPETFAAVRDRLARALRPVLREFDAVIAHNVLTQPFNLALTAAIFQLLDESSIRRCLAWCHDLTWTSPDSPSAVFPGYPWDLLRTFRQDVQYITVSEQRRRDLVELFNQPSQKIELIYNGVEPCVWYGLSPEGWGLVQRMDLLSGDLILLMPVRVSQSKNIELAAQVLASLKENGCNPRLVITGPPDPPGEDSLGYYRSLLDLRDRLGLQRELRFVCGTGEDPDDLYHISQQVDADLVRVSDVLFMPSHRKGFSMPVLEAGLIGMPVVSSNRVLAAKEIGGKNVYLFNAHAAPEEIARLILESVAHNRPCRFRQQVRQNFTWEQIFHKMIEPVLQAA